MPSVIGILEALPFENLIGGPLKAAIKAQGDAAKATVEFINAVGFQPAPNKPARRKKNAMSQMDGGTVRNVTFNYTKKLPTGGTSSASLQVPILTIVPIPFIRIEEMTIDFTAKITETIEETNDTTNQSETGTEVGAEGGADFLWWDASADFKASYSSSQTSTEHRSSRYNFECTLNIHLRAVQDSLPAGMSRILGILEAQIKEPAPTAVSAQPATTNK